MSTAVFFFLNFINLNRLLSSFRFHSLRRSFHRTVQNFSGASTEFFDKLFSGLPAFVCLFLSLSLSLSLSFCLSVCLTVSVGRSVGLSGGGCLSVSVSLSLRRSLSSKRCGSFLCFCFCFVFVLFWWC